MSRRKQAKPRAVHKAGELDEPLNQNTSSQLLDPKAELLSDNDTEDDDDHTAEIDDHDTVADISEEPPKINQNNGIHLELTDSLRQTGGNIRNLKINVMTNLPSELNDQIDDEMEIFEDVGLEDENSLDSFYSDLYSSHTSASYSPSISEGTATPNSLNHHSLDIHHHHNLNNNHHHPHNELTGEIENNNHIRGGNRNHNLRRRSISSVNGGGSETLRDINGAEDDEDDDDDDDDNNNGDDENAENNHKNDIGSDDERITKANGARRQNIKKLSTAATTTTTAAAAVSTDVTKVATNNSVAAGGNAGKFSIGKLRKIERDSMKSEKMTSDGIKNTSDGSYQCQFCDKSFPRLGYLKKHEQSHAEHLPFKCDYCARLFKHKRSRDRHTKLHTGDRRYRCPHCEAAFSRSDHLKIHMKTHDNQKPFQCTICNRGYNTAAALTSHMQNHKKQAALLAAGGVPSNMNYSPRSTGSGSSNGSYHKRRYGTIENSPAHLPEYPKRVRNSYISCIYCTKTDFANLEQLNAHIQTMHENVAVKEVPNISMGSPGAALQLSCEYCTMKFPNIPKMFQHMRTTHIDRLASPNTYFEQFNRLAATGTFSPRLATPKDSKVKTEEPSPKMEKVEAEKEDEPTDLSQPKRRSQTPSLNSDAAEKPGIFLCNQCNAGLPDFETFRNHLKTHITQGINLVCHHCGLTLREQSEYERHIISHFLITNSEYACSANCNKTFAKPDELHKHLFDNHVQTMYKCTLCSDLFVTKLSLKVHFACDHSQENKVFRCSACMDSFRTENDFGVHVKTRHQTVTGTSIQCMFCRMVCSSELEMHFHLAAHGRQFRCPSCPETFHVEFLLDRHMQTHHNTKENGHISPIIASNPTPIYLNPPFAKQAVPQNNNNNILDYHAFAANKNLFPNSSGKFYSPLQVDTNAIGGQIKHPLMYGLGQRYFDTNKTLLDMYNYHQEKSAANYFVSPNPPSFEHSRTPKPSQIEKPNERNNSNHLQNGFSCGICERNDFRTEAEVHSHRKIVHNLKTGVSLRCAYCSGNFKSRSELEHHMKTCHNSTGKHKCLICDEIFPSPAILAEHKLQHSKVGQSGKCSHCSASLDSISAFKSHLSEHNSEGNIPVQCICCRQTLNSDFEVGLHAKFHTKSSNAPENTCALCLEPIGPNSDAKVCEKCCRKHNLSSKLSNMRFEATKSFVENRCNLCKMILPHAQRLQEHLVEHTFVGCEERGYTCYICSAVFTVPAGLLSHMNEHGQNARPYDCNLCTEKYFFRAELDNHLVDHENGSKAETQNHNHNGNENVRLLAAYHQKDIENRELSSAKADNPTTVEVKRELEDSAERHENDDDDEYIEVEKVPEPTNTNATCTSSNDKEINDEQF